MSRYLPIVLILVLVLYMCNGPVTAQPQLGYDTAEEAERALADAQRQGEAASRRAAELEGEAARATEAADRTARETAALAARVQQTEAAIAANEARIRLIESDRAKVRASLSARQRPLVRLTGALQRLSRRPMVLSLLRPGSLQDAAHLRAMLETMLPEVERRTAALKQELAQVRALQVRAEATRQALNVDRAELAQRRQALAALETRQRLASRDASGVADREAERALALAEQARDLGALTRSLSEAGALRDRLAALPGPVMRPDRPDLARVAEIAPPAPATPAGLTGFRLPVDGRLVAGFGEEKPGVPVSRGIALAPRAGAQVVAPAGGRVAFAGAYRGYGTIVIIEHSGGWTSLVTGLALASVEVGDNLVAGSPLGTVGQGRPVVTFEVRRGGEPVNPLDLARI